MSYRRVQPHSFHVIWRKGHTKGQIDGIARTIDALDDLAKKRPDLSAAEAATVLRGHLDALRAVAE